MKTDVAALGKEVSLLKEAVLAVRDFYEARSNHDNTPYKYDHEKVVTEKREIMVVKLAEVEPLLQGAR